MASTARAISLLRAATAHDRRRHRRVPARLRGRLLDRAGREFDCQTVNVSVSGALVRVPGSGRPVGAAVLYLDLVGRVTAEPVREDGSLQALVFTVSAAKRERIAEALTEAINPLALEADRRAPRYAGVDETVLATPENGRSFPVTLLDVSLVGALVSAPGATLPSLGSWVRIGQTWGRVARYTEGGFALDFQPRPKG